LWKEENIDVDTTLSASAELRNAGITANSMSGDIGGLASNAPGPEMMGDQGGDEGSMDTGGTNSPVGGAGSAPTA
jgi:hypothetical protein